MPGFFLSCLNCAKNEKNQTNPALRSDSGNVAPIRVISGPKSGIKNPTGVYLDTVHQELVVANMGNHSATVYPRTAEGDTPPLRTIRSAPAGRKALDIGNPGAVAYDTKRDQILVPN